MSVEVLHHLMTEFPFIAHYHTLWNILLSFERHSTYIDKFWHTQITPEWKLLAVKGSCYCNFVRTKLYIALLWEQNCTLQCCEKYCYVTHSWRVPMAHHTPWNWWTSFSYWDQLWHTQSHQSGSWPFLGVKGVLVGNIVEQVLNCWLLTTTLILSLKNFGSDRRLPWELTQRSEW